MHWCECLQVDSRKMVLSTATLTSLAEIKKSSVGCSREREAYPRRLTEVQSSHIGKPLSEYKELVAAESNESLEK